MLSLACMIRHELGIAYAYFTYFEIFIIYLKNFYGFFRNSADNSGTTSMKLLSLPCTIMGDLSVIIRYVIVYDKWINYLMNNLLDLSDLTWSIEYLSCWTHKVKVLCNDTCLSVRNAMTQEQL